jgi:hypothetical protein
MTYPNFNGVLMSTETCVRNSPIIQGVPVFGLTHDYGDIAAGCTLDFTFGHFQQLSLSENAIITITNTPPPGTFGMLLKVTQTGVGGWTINWNPDLSCPAAAPDNLLTLTVPDAVDIIRLHYGRARNAFDPFTWWATSFAKNVNKAPVTIAVTTITNPVDVAETSQCTATATYSDATTKDITTSCVWASSAAGKVKMNATLGEMEGVAVGAANITATCGLIVGTLAVTCH